MGTRRTRMTPPTRRRNSRSNSADTAEHTELRLRDVRNHFGNTNVPRDQLPLHAATYRGIQLLSPDGASTVRAHDGRIRIDVNNLCAWALNDGLHDGWYDP